MGRGADAKENGQLRNREEELRRLAEVRAAQLTKPPKEKTPPAHQEPVLAVSPEEAARRLGIGRGRLYLLLGSKEIRSFKIGQRRLVPVTELQAWLDRRLAEEFGDE